LYIIEKKPKIYDKPVLGYIIVGHDPQSESYVKMKLKACDEIGIEYQGQKLDQFCTEKELLDCVESM
jgi:methylenetetrahydrofolate dehydrogenase (NADP+)/methenyltetrahydrofolate cyclohydrolase